MSKVYGQDCLIARVLDLVGDRWTLLIVRELLLGKQRFTDILEGCGRVSPNLLSDRLKKLETNGLVERAYFRELPPRVEYRLTERGDALRGVLQALIDWGVEHMDDTQMQPDCLNLQAWLQYASSYYFDPAAARGVQATYVIRVNGESGYLTVADGACEAGEGEPAGGADVVFEGEPCSWLDAVFDRCDFHQALASGTLKYEGSAEKAQLFPVLISRRPSPVAAT
ncbi:MAG: winged helix-turn-helix transcriptional regulator [Dehalococcoidia bacterium]